MRKFSHVLLLVLLPIFVMAQHTVSGTVTNAATGDALPGANVVVEGTNMGAAAAADGSFSISNVPAGSYTITASVIGYADDSRSVNVSGDATVNFSLETSTAIIFLTPMAFKAIKAEMPTPPSPMTTTESFFVGFI